MSHPQLKLSLQTKLLFIITLITALALVGSSAFNYVRSIKANESASEENILSLKQILDKLLEGSTQQFEQDLSQIAVDSLINTASGNAAPKILSINPTIHSITILDFTGQVLRQWQTDNVSHSISQNLETQLIELVKNKQSPVSRIHCGDSCYQSSYVPVISDNGKLLIISAVRSLQQVFVDFAALTRANVAFLSRSGSSGYDTILASRSGQTTALIVEIEKLTGFLATENPVYVETSQGLFAAVSVALSNQLSATPLTAVILADNSIAQAQIRQSLNTSLITAGIALLITFLLAYLALRTTLRKLVTLSNVIPLLSDSNYDRLRSSLFRYTKNPGFVDEIDQLTFTVLEVADALEEMETSVAKHRQQLVQKIAEHRETQDFNDVLVNDSPLVIIAHAISGKIKLLNNYGRELVGWSHRGLENHSITELILPDLSGHSITENLHPLLSGKQTRIQSEQLIKSTRGTVSELMWIHAIVKTGGEPLILSVGLDITERRRTESRLRWLSKHDNVTDLLNREAFHEEANLLIQQYCESHRVELLVMDVDKFSAINDMHGFHGGDTILRETARFIERLISCDTIIARTGANEFCALLIIDKDTIKDQGHPIQNRKLKFFSVLNDEALEITLTGILATHPQDGQNIDEMVSNSAAALRDLKPVDRGKINRIPESVDNRALRQEKLHVHDSIVKALSEERFILVYQPIYDLQSSRISHCECLVRMCSEEGHLLSPATFMDIAKENGLMARLDLMVLRMALEQLGAWGKQEINIKLSVNITAETFESDLFIRELKSMLWETGARASQLIFEIVETEAINNLETARELCERLAALDIQIAFDDFGIGFTSFEYLRELPVDYIKIDQSFIRYLYKRKSDQLLVKSMVDMAVALGKKVIAEGVEDDGSADILEGMGVHYLQGYFISRPCRIEDLNLNFKMGIQ